MNNKVGVELFKIELAKSILKIWGKINLESSEVFSQILKCGFYDSEGQFFEAHFETSDESKDGSIVQYFSVEIELDKKWLKIKPYIEMKKSIFEITISEGKFLPVYRTVRRSYAVRGSYVLWWKENFLNVKWEKNIRASERKHEVKYLIELLKLKKLKTIIYRIKAKLFAYFSRYKKIWLISDRTYVANDNGEFFFRYLAEVANSKREKIVPYFVISKKSADFERMKKYGKVVALESKKYRTLFLNCDKLISSSANEITINPFGKNKKYVADLYKFDFVFLQHGIIKDDMSGWLNKSNKNISLFITSAEREKSSIVEGKYVYDETEVALTGIPRFDNLLSKEGKSKKQVVILPTWRSYLKNSYNAKTSKSIYDSEFIKSDFYSFYNSLINDKRLLDIMETLGYKGLFGLHPIHEKQACDFCGNSVFEICSGLLDYQKLFVESSLLITDYSSTAMDFCYLQKPVVYVQFDKEVFFSSHTYQKGYFDYEQDGFGPVCYDIDSAVAAISKILKQECLIEECYKNRVTSFFKYIDTENCKRIYQCINEKEDVI